MGATEVRARPRVPPPGVPARCAGLVETPGGGIHAPRRRHVESPLLAWRRVEAAARSPPGGGSRPRPAPPLRRGRSAPVWHRRAGSGWRAGSGRWCRAGRAGRRRGGRAPPPGRSGPGWAETPSMRVATSCDTGGVSRLRPRVPRSWVTCWAPIARPAWSPMRAPAPLTAPPGVPTSVWAAGAAPGCWASRSIAPACTDGGGAPSVRRRGENPLWTAGGAAWVSVPDVTASPRATGAGAPWVRPPAGARRWPPPPVRRLRG